jgi:hypothetical protein
MTLTFASVGFLQSIHKFEACRQIAISVLSRVAPLAPVRVSHTIRLLSRFAWYMQSRHGFGLSDYNLVRDLPFDVSFANGLLVIISLLLLYIQQSIDFPQECMRIVPET